MDQPHSDPFPVHGADFDYQTSYYPSSASSPEGDGSSGERFSKNKGYHHNRCERKHHACHQKHRQEIEECHSERRAAGEVAEREIQCLKIRLFHASKEAKKYDDAEMYYHEVIKKYDDARKLDHVTVTGRDPSKNEVSVILELRHSFAGMLMEEKRFQDAESISREVWDQRKRCPGPPSEVFKESHRQLCAALCAMKRHMDAEHMHRSMYQSKTMDAWALENGDEVCQRLKEQGQKKRAKEMQDEVWEKRREHIGPRDDFTIRSGMRLVEFLQDLVSDAGHQRGTEAESRLFISRKQGFEDDIEEVLRKTWDTRLQPEPNTDMLHAGHELGKVLLKQNKFLDAEAVFMPVWEGKKQRPRETDRSTMSTGSMLGEALYRQGKRETSLRAVDILEGIWRVRQAVIENDDAEAIPSGKVLAQAYCSLGDWPNSERTYKSIVKYKELRGFPTQEIDEARWDLAQIFYRQGLNRNREAGIVLGDLYYRWNASSPKSSLTLQCGQMLAQSLSTQDGRAHEALNVVLEVFNGRDASAKRGAAYQDSGRLYGSLLLNNGNLTEAEGVLESLWEHQAEGAAEQDVRLKCGHLYGQTLAQRHKYLDARRILDAVAAGREAMFPAGVPEIEETRLLLEKVNRLEKEKKRGKRHSRHNGFTGLRRNGV